MSDLVQEALEDGILDERVHEQLLVRLPQAARRAGVPAEAICRHLRQYVEDDEERAWVREVMRHRASPPAGLVYVGRFRSGVRERLEGMAGAFIRNFMDARVMYARRALEEGRECLVLLLPGIPEEPRWLVGEFAELVLDRMSQGKVTILHVPDFEDLRARAGRGFTDALERNFKMVMGGKARA